MKCKVCKQTMRDLKDGMCFKCYVLKHAIRLKPEMTRSIGVVHVPNANVDLKHKLLSFLPAVFDVNVDDKDARTRLS